MSPTLTGADLRHFKALSVRSDAKGALHLAAHLGLLSASSALVLAAWPGWWLLPAWPLQAILLVSLFCPLHESIHRTAFRSRWLNDTVAWICGGLLLLPPNWFRAYHNAHHRWTQDPERDPELIVPKPRTLGAYLAQLSGLPYWWRQVRMLLRHAAGRVTHDFVPSGERDLVVKEARILLAVYGLAAIASLAGGSLLLALLWVVPALLGQPFLRAYLMAEHGGCPLVANMLENSRTTRSNALVRWLAWNMPYHAEHHAYPALPFHALPAAHRLLAPRIRYQASGYIAVHRSLAAQLGSHR